MKIFFMGDVPNNISMSLRVSAVTAETIFPRKTIKISCFFMFVDHCRDSYSKCMHCGHRSTETCIFSRARSWK